MTLLVRRVEEQPPWRSTVALGSGILVAAYGVLDASWDAAAHRAAELGPELAGYAFDLGNIGFANAWLAMASLAVSAGWGHDHDRRPPALHGLVRRPGDLS